MDKKFLMRVSVIASLILCIVIAMFALCACGSAKNSNSSSSNSSQDTSASSDNTIRMLNFKPEIAAFMTEACAKFSEETGYKVIVDTAANGQYETTLTSKMSGDEAPTLFVINGQNGYKS